MGKPQEATQESDLVVIGTRVTRPMYDALIQLLALDSHVTVSDYLRDILRRDLQEKGLLKMAFPKQMGPSGEDSERQESIQT